MSETIDAPPTTPAAADPPAPAAAAQQDWRAALPEDLRAAPSLTKFADPVALAKGYVEAEKLISRKGVIPPKDGDPPEVLAAYRAALGVPEKPEDYGLKAPENLPAGMWSDESAQAYAALAHKHGLTPAQAQGLAAEFLAAQAQRVPDLAAEQKQAETELRGEWGAAYEAKIELAKRAIGQFAPPEFAQFLEATGLGNHPQLARMLARIGESVAEDRPAGMGTGARVSTDPKVEISELMAKGSPYWHPLDPKHKETVARVKELFAATS
jgi:hypothetical protein